MNVEATGLILETVTVFLSGGTLLLLVGLAFRGGKWMGKVETQLRSLCHRVGQLEDKVK